MGGLLPLATVSAKGLMPPTQYFMRKYSHIEDCDNFRSLEIGIITNKTLNSPFENTWGFIIYVGDEQDIFGIQLAYSGDVCKIRLFWDRSWNNSGWKTFTFT